MNIKSAAHLNLLLNRRVLYIFLSFLLLYEILMLGAFPPMLAEGWLSDIAYHLNWEFNGKMAKDIPYGENWNTGIGKAFFFLHFIFYKLFGVGLYQARFVTLLSGLLLLIFVFIWTHRNISKEAALFSVLLLGSSVILSTSLHSAQQDTMHCLFAFVSFYLISSAVLFKKQTYFFWAGLFSALSVDISYRGIEIVLAVYLFYFIFSEKRSFFKPLLLLLTGSFISFIYWVSLNILSIGFSNYIEYIIPGALGDGGAYSAKVLSSEILRFIDHFGSGVTFYFTTVQVLYLFFLLIIFCKYRSKYRLIFKIILTWLTLILIIMSVVERTVFPAYVLMYYPLVCILAGIGLSELFARKKKLALCVLCIIASCAMIYRGGLFVKYIHRSYFTKKYDLSRYYEQLRSNVDLDKNIIGTTNHWYGFPDAQYYGGQFYLSRVITVLHELSPVADYDNEYERSKALMNVLKKRKIEYIIADEAFKPTIIQYFPNNVFPDKNFMLIDTIKDRYLGCAYGSRGPCTTEIYKVIYKD